MKIKKEDFELVKLKVLPNGGLHIIYNHTRVAEDEVFVAEHSLKQEVVPRPALTNLLNGLNQMIAIVFGYGELDDEKFDSLSALLKTTGFTMTGEEELRSVILIGQKVSDMFVLNLITHQILLEGDQFGFESELDKLLESIREEVFEYAINEKYAQTKLLFEMSN